MQKCRRGFSLLFMILLVMAYTFPSNDDNDNQTKISKTDDEDTNNITNDMTRQLY